MASYNIKQLTEARIDFDDRYAMRFYQDDAGKLFTQIIDKKDAGVLADMPIDTRILIEIAEAFSK